MLVFVRLLVLVPVAVPVRVVVPVFVRVLLPVPVAVPVRVVVPVPVVVRVLVPVPVPVLTRPPDPVVPPELVLPPLPVEPPYSSVVCPSPSGGWLALSSGPHASTWRPDITVTAHVLKSRDRIQSLAESCYLSRRTSGRGASSLAGSFGPRKESTLAEAVRLDAFDAGAESFAISPEN